MSQRGRPGSSQGLNDPQRMPFEAAEALLWGKKTHDEHKFLFPRMKALEEHHKAYDHRIQVTEAVAEAAQAATARIVHIEQKVAAIEADEQDRPFDKWVEGEISGFKSFIEKNKSIRQKQVELENKVHGLEDVVDRNRDAHRDVQILLERIARLENERINDSKNISRLEGEIERLAQAPQERAVEHSPVITQPVQERMPVHQGPPQVFHRDHEALDAAEETEDEDMQRSYSFELPLQDAVPHRPRESRSPTVALPTSPQKGREHLSARLRMMQRNSIYEPKQSRHGNRPPAGASALLEGAFSNVEDSAPPTQIVDRRGAKRGNPIQEVAAIPPQPSPKKSLIVRLNTRRVNTQAVKAEEDAPVPRLTRSQARKIQEAEQTQPRFLEQKATSEVLETRVVDKPAAKRRKLNDSRASAQPLPMADEPKKAADPASRATSLHSTSRSIKSPRKKPANTAKEASSPKKKHTARSQGSATGLEMDDVHLDNAMQPDSRTMAMASSPSKRSKVQPKVIMKAPRAMETVRLDDDHSDIVHMASSPRKKKAAPVKVTAKATRTAKSDQMNDVTSTSSRTLDVASSPRKKNGVQPKVTSKTSRAKDPIKPNHSASASSRTLPATSSPRKKNPVSSKAASKASKTSEPLPSDISTALGSRPVSPKKTYSRSKAQREVLHEGQHDTYDSIDDDEW